MEQYRYEILRDFQLPYLNRIENLIFQGGGVRVFGYLGPLQVLCDNNSYSKIDLRKIKRVGGASAGSITSLIIGANYSITEIENVLLKLNLATILDETVSYTSDDEKQHIIQARTTALTLIKLYLDSRMNKINLLLYILCAIIADFLKVKISQLTSQQVNKWLSDIQNKTKITEVMKFCKECYKYIKNQLPTYVADAVDLLQEYMESKAYDVGNFIISKLKELTTLQTNIMEYANLDRDEINALDTNIAHIFKSFLWVKNTKKGLFTGDAFLKWIGDRLKEKNIDEDITFSQWEQIKKDKNLKDLYIVALNVLTGYTEVFSARTTPHVVIRYATRASVSIPYFFEPCKIKSIEITSTGKHETFLNSFYVDGGVLDNYPVWMFDRYEFLNSWDRLFIHPHYSSYNDNTLGFSLIERDRKKALEFKVQPSIPNNLILQDLGHLHYLSCLSKSVLFKEDNDRFHSTNEYRTIFIDVQNVNMIEFSLTDEKKEKLIQSGRDGANIFLCRRALHERKLYNQSYMKLFYTAIDAIIECFVWYPFISSISPPSESYNISTFLPLMPSASLLFSGDHDVTTKQFYSNNNTFFKKKSNKIRHYPTLKLTQIGIATLLVAIKHFTLDDDNSSFQSKLLIIVLGLGALYSSCHHAVYENNNSELHNKIRSLYDTFLRENKYLDDASENSVAHHH